MSNKCQRIEQTGPFKSYVIQWFRGIRISTDQRYEGVYSSPILTLRGVGKFTEKI